jgi:hypothetical protein
MQTVKETRIPVRNGFVVVNEMADRLGKERSAFRRAVLKAGFVPDKRRLDATGGQSVNVMTRQEAERFIAERRAKSLDGGTIEFIDPT